MKSYYQMESDIRTEAKDIINNFNYSTLYTKEACFYGWQVVKVTGNLCDITFRAKRLYPDTQKYKTNTETNIYLYISDKAGNVVEYNLIDFKKIIDWHFPERPHRLIIPNILLSKKNIKPLINKVLNNNLPTYSSEAEHFVYYTDLDGAENIIKKYNTIIIENYGD